jgi:hypothetical protein
MAREVSTGGDSGGPRASCGDQQARRLGALPLRACAISSGWRERGRAGLLTVREQRDGLFVVGRFEVDVWCLGLTFAAVAADVDASALVRLRRDTFGEQPPLACSAQLAALLVYGGIEYAAALGFAPHPAWSIARHILPPASRAPTAPGDASSPALVEFGREGKPCYVAGAADDEAVLARLEARLGPDAFHVLLR